MLSRVLADLYDLAEEVPMHAFPYHLLHVLKKLVEYDAAILGAGSMNWMWKRPPNVNEAAADGCVLLSGQEADSVWRGIRKHSMDHRLRFVCEDCQEGSLYAALDRRDAGAAPVTETELLLYAPDDHEPGYWGAFYRGNGSCFRHDDQEHLHFVWPHVSRGLAMNRKRSLERQLRKLDAGAGAFINRGGAIEIAEPNFKQLLSTEWPRFKGDQLPLGAMEAWHGGHPYRGTKIEIRFEEQGECLLCIASPYAILTGLTKTEGMVARYFASGLSHKEVAQTLGVSENTVRTHLKQAYSKLGVHDKAQLANRIGTPAR